ncbi:MAG: CBS domain-containing protein [Myxococcota bacterium]|nr:CBS domain-containing protein [Myxococcota bacterium]
MYLVQDFMTRKVLSLEEHDDLTLAQNLMAFGRFRHLPVTRSGALIGLVSQRDLARAQAQRDDLLSLRTLDVMIREVQTVSPQTRLRDALELMLRHKYGCVPVVDGDGVLVGILTEEDGVRFALRMAKDLDEVGEVIEFATEAALHPS